MGRKLSFDVEEALDAAMRVFWEKGYESASIDDLATAIGVNRPSIYNSFGNKEALFRLVFQRYETKRLGFAWRALQEDRALDVAKHFILGFLDLATDPATPSGCLGINASSCGSEEGRAVRFLIQERRAIYHATLLRRFEEARDKGDLPTSVTAMELTDFTFLLVSGLALQARAGVSKTDLRATIDIALGAFFPNQREPDGLTGIPSRARPLAGSGCETKAPRTDRPSDRSR